MLPRSLLRATRTNAHRAVMFLLCLAGSWCITSPASAAGPYGPAYRACGSFHATYRIRVYATGMSCRRAVAIQKEWWLGPPTRQVVVNGGSGAGGYVLLKRYPGWRCSSGSGGGQCVRGPAVAAYQN